jgi:[acyl-carrier-protein] S-malonyltransferase
MAITGGTSSAIVFPGMGPCRFETVAKFMLINRIARRLTDVASEVLGYDLFERYRTADGDYSEYAQVAFLVNCLALAEWAQEELGATPGLCAGASFGSKAAAIYSKAITFEAGVRLTAGLSRLETEYFATEHTDVVTQSFVRIPPDCLADLLTEMDSRGQWYEVSCYIDTDFHMVSVCRGELEMLQKSVRARGGMPLYVMDPPLHCRAFTGLRDRADAELFGSVDFADPVLGMVSDQDGTVLNTADAVRTSMLDGIVRPVRWPSVVRTMRRNGIGKVHVAGPDSLFGRVRCTTENFEVVKVDPRMAMRPRRRGWEKVHVGREVRDIVA